MFFQKLDNYKQKGISRFLLQIVCIPLVLFVWALCLIFMICTVLFEFIPFIGDSLETYFLKLTTPLFPIVGVLYFVHTKSVFINEHHLILNSLYTKSKIKWFDIEKLYDSFDPPSIRVKVMLKNRKTIDVSYLTDKDVLEAEFKKRGIKIELACWK